MKVLHVITDTNVGGAGRYLLYLLPQPAFRELDVAVACPDGELAVRLEAAGIRRIPISGRDVSFSPRLTVELARLLREERPDIVHTHGSLSGRIAARLRKVPVVYTKHGQVKPANRTGAALHSPGALPRFVGGTAARLLADRVIAVSDGVRRELEASGISPRMIAVIPNGIDLRPYRRSVRRLAKAQAAALDDTGRRAFLIGTLARLSPEKGLDTLIDAAKIVVASYPSARFVIGGTGPLEADLTKKIRDLRLEPYVRLAGFVDDVPGFLGDLDLFVLPSYSEGIGLAIIEAMAAGLPVVASAVGGVPEVVADGVTGLLVPPRQPKALAQAIVRLLVDPDLARSMGASGREKVERLHDAKVAAEKTVQVYREVLASKAEARPGKKIRLPIRLPFRKTGKPS
ncbi:MAG TPA: glycosyltransferase family 4 protein [Firmicutes bacterium]|nr:glycosyltransferase family 4 protein [Candidatus Fermentithermobacillaceae bacterium]